MAIVFSVDSYNKTVKQAVQEYARSWPDGERKVKWIDPYTFMFRDGMRKYHVKLVSNVYIIEA